MNWLALHIVKQHYKHQIINRIEQKKCIKPYLRNQLTSDSQQHKIKGQSNITSLY